MEKAGDQNILSFTTAEAIREDARGIEKKRRIFLSLLSENIQEAELVENIRDRMAFWKDHFGTAEPNDAPLTTIYAVELTLSFGSPQEDDTQNHPRGLDNYRLMLLKEIYSTTFLDFPDNDTITTFYKKIERAFNNTFGEKEPDYKSIIDFIIRATLISPEERAGLLGEE